MAGDAGGRAGIARGGGEPAVPRLASARLRRRRIPGARPDITGTPRQSASHSTYARSAAASSSVRIPWSEVRGDRLSARGLEEPRDGDEGSVESGPPEQATSSVEPLATYAPSAVPTRRSNAAVERVRRGKTSGGPVMRPAYRSPRRQPHAC